MAFRMTNQYTRLQFTINNFTEADHKMCAEIPIGEGFIVYGEEIGESGTPHLQGYIRTSTQHQGSWFKRRLGQRVHLEKAIGDEEINDIYCKKGRMSKAVWEELRSDREALVQHPTYGLAAVVFRRGGMDPTIGRTGAWGGDRRSESWITTMPWEKKKLDFTNIQEKLWEHSVWNDVLTDPELQNHVAERYQFCEKLWHARPIVSVELPDWTPRMWQKELEDVLLANPDPRKIQFIYGEKGGEGKSMLVKRWVKAGKAILINNKEADAAYALSFFKGSVIFIDLPRSMKDHTNWGLVEKIKNGLLFSGKYMSKQVVAQQDWHVVIMMNFMPPMDAFSADRYDIWEIKDQDCQVWTPPIMLQQGAQGGSDLRRTMGETLDSDDEVDILASD